MVGRWNFLFEMGAIVFLSQKWAFQSEGKLTPWGPGGWKCTGIGMVRWPKIQPFQVMVNFLPMVFITIFHQQLRENILSIFWNNTKQSQIQLLLSGQNWKKKAMELHIHVSIGNTIFTPGHFFDCCSQISSFEALEVFRIFWEFPSKQATRTFCTKGSLQIFLLLLQKDVEPTRHPHSLSYSPQICVCVVFFWTMGI